jgi:2-polyprenyl-6-methoxyphenol hydroxylase-like FAD-dependent oxidoreductase
MMDDVLIVGAGIGGLTLGLALQARGIPCRVFEAAPTIAPIGVGINILPHAMQEFAALGLETALAQVGVTTAESCFYNRFGQFIHKEPLGRNAGYAWPQISIHRGELEILLYEAFKARVGVDRIATGWRCRDVEQDAQGVTAHFQDENGKPLPSQRGRALIGCDGIHSTIRKHFYPDEGDPIYSGVNMWRGVTRWTPFLSGASYVRCGWLTHGKLVVYPISNALDEAGRQLINWVIEIETPQYKQRRDWNRPGRLEDFIAAFADWHFDWLDVPALLRSSAEVLEFPMVDQDPLERWSFDRVTLLGDAAHPMYPRGSNGAGQAVVDVRFLADSLARHEDAVAALRAYEAIRLPATTQVVLTNRTSPPDVVIREVFLRTGDKPFRNIDEVITKAEILALTDGYKKAAGYDHATMAARAAEAASAQPIA